jgi:hypothetical protein
MILPLVRGARTRDPAVTNLKSLIELMKTEAVFLGRADRLDRDAFQAVHRQFERKALLTPVSLLAERILEGRALFTPEDH